MAPLLYVIACAVPKKTILCRVLRCHFNVTMLGYCTSSCLGSAWSQNITWLHSFSPKVYSFWAGQALLEESNTCLLLRLVLYSSPANSASTVIRTNSCLSFELFEYLIDYSRLINPPSISCLNGSTFDYSSQFQTK